MTCWKTGCVEDFYKALKISQNAFDIYCFNMIAIGKLDEVLTIFNENPEKETALELAINILDGKRAICMPSIIFANSIYTSNNGIVNFAFGQSSDWASAILFAKNTGIYYVNKK